MGSGRKKPVRDKTSLGPLNLPYILYRRLFQVTSHVIVTKSIVKKKKKKNLGENLKYLKQFFD